MSRRGFSPLRSRLLILFTLAVFALGSLNLLIVGRVSYRALTQEQARRLSFAAGLLARRVRDPILREDWVELKNLLNESVEVDPELAYVVVSDPRGRCLAHTFRGEIPKWIFSQELVRNDRKPELRFRAGGDGRFIREIARPVLDGELGLVRVGIDEAGARAEVMSLLSVLAAMVLVFLIGGVAATGWVARRITRPISSIITAVEAFDPGSDAAPIEVSSGDEIELLAEHVESMMSRLRRLYESERLRAREFARVERLAALGTLAAGLAHELNNPLAGIKSAAQSLPRMLEDPQRVSKYSRVIVDAARRMERVLKGMLDFSRPREVKLSDVSVQDCVSSALGLGEARLKKSCVGIKLPSDLPLVRADRDILIQVIVNVLLNAADAVGVCDGHSECERPKIYVDAVTKGDLVEIRIHDAGPGIPEELRERIFDPFFTTKPAGQGTGLGLPTAWSSVREMGGRLSLDSESGSGACFVVELQWAGEVV